MFFFLNVPFRNVGIASDDSVKNIFKRKSFENVKKKKKNLKQIWYMQNI